MEQKDNRQNPEIPSNRLRQPSQSRQRSRPQTEGQGTILPPPINKFAPWIAHGNVNECHIFGSRYAMGLFWWPGKVDYLFAGLIRQRYFGEPASPFEQHYFTWDLCVELEYPLRRAGEAWIGATAFMREFEDRVNTYLAGCDVAGIADQVDIARHDIDAHLIANEILGLVPCGDRVIHMEALLEALHEAKEEDVIRVTEKIQHFLDGNWHGEGQDIPASPQLDALADEYSDAKKDLLRDGQAPEPDYPDVDQGPEPEKR